MMCRFEDEQPLGGLVNFLNTKNINLEILRYAAWKINIHRAAFSNIQISKFSN